MVILIDPVRQGAPRTRLEMWFPVAGAGGEAGGVVVDHRPGVTADLPAWKVAEIVVGGESASSGQVGGREDRAALVAGIGIPGVDECIVIDPPVIRSNM